jgi:serine/threonine-protein kinase HipA
MELEVTIQIESADVRAGTLFSHVKRGVETASFLYAPDYLARPDAFALSPDLPLVSGTLHSAGKPMFSAFEDCMPDRWGRNLMLRAERFAARAEGRAARSLFEGDMLCAVSDATRQGALRIWLDGVPVAPSESGVPREIGIPALLDSADKAARDMDADVRDLLAAGSSLGGARPKASVRNERGALCIAKFPKVDELLDEDVCAWEHVALQLAAKAGISVPATRLIRVAGRSVLLLERFDRNGDGRIPYLSGMSAIQGEDGGRHSYLDLVEFLEGEGAEPSDDLPELWRRVLFTCAIGNTDNHMRNYGFLRAGKGWRLSPSFDVNPTPGDGQKYLSTSLDYDENEASVEAAVGVAEYFRVSDAAARSTAARMAAAMKSWRKVARANGISQGSIGHMATCFEAGVASLERVAR